MKTISVLGIFLFSVLLDVSTTVSASAVPAPTPWTVVSRRADSAVWQRTTYEQLPDGKVVPHLHKYTELASGLNYKDANGKWQPSRDIIEAYAGGAIARYGQYQVIFANNLNSAGSIDMQTPDGKRLRSNILGLGYVDESTGKAVLIAEVQDSQGELISSNQVLYPNAFKGVKADVRYTYKKGSFEQDVILREQPPSPESFGLNPETTKIEVMTEFLNPPAAKLIRRHSGTVEEVDWGTMRIGQGRAFGLGNSKTNQRGVRVNKRYMDLEGRHILLEQVSMPDIQSALSQLPLQSAASRKTSVLIARKGLTLPARRMAEVESKKMEVALGNQAKKGYVLDYTLFVNSSGPMDFQAGTTYLVTGPAYLSGSVTFEGGAVIKYDTNTVIEYGVGYGTTVNWQTGPYDPVIFTASSDNSVGESTGDNSPGGSYTALVISGDCQVHDARICDAGTAVEMVDPSATVGVTNLQVVNCQVGFDFDWASGCKLILTNCLIVSPSPTYSPASAVIMGGSNDPAYTATATLYNCTIDNFSALGASNSDDYTGPANIYITNSVLSNIGDWGTGTVGGSGDAFESGTTPSPFGDSTQITCSNPYDVVEGGSYYINSSLGANAEPVDEAWDTINGDTTLGPQPYVTSIGYNYPRIDYILNDSWIWQGTVTVEPGTVIAVEGYGVSVDSPVTLNFAGTAANPCYLIEGNMVQENGSAQVGIYGYPDGYGNPSGTDWPTINANFTKFYTPADSFVFAYQSTLNANYANCEFYGGSFGSTISGFTADAGINLSFKNCLLDVTSVYVFGNDSPSGVTNSFELQNCTLHNASLHFNVGSHFSKFAVQDSAMDGGVELVYTGSYAGSVCSSNAYLSGLDLFPSDTSVLTNIISFNWQRGPLGDFYLPTNSPLIDAGNMLAAVAGLNGFTTQTNQSQDSGTVDIGYHYPIAGNGSWGTNFWLSFFNMYGGGPTLSLLISSAEGASGTVTVPAANGSELTLSGCAEANVNGTYVLTDMPSAMRSLFGSWNWWYPTFYNPGRVYLKDNTNIVCLDYDLYNQNPRWDVIVYNPGSQNSYDGFGILYQTAIGNQVLNNAVWGDDWASDTPPTSTVCSWGPVTLPFTLPAGGATNLLLPAEAMVWDYDQVEDRGVRVTSTAPVAVYGMDYTPQASAAFTAYPTSFLGTNYCLMGWTSFGGSGSQFEIVGTESDTTVTIIPSSSANLVGHLGMYTETLQPGQIYQINSQVNYSLYPDVTGTRISSDKPIAVFSGNKEAIVPDYYTSYANPLVQEQLPVEDWGTEALSLSFAGRTNGDTYRVLAAYNNTAVSITGTVVTVVTASEGDAGGPWQVTTNNETVVTTLDAGQWTNIIVDGPAVFQANQPIQVAKFANGGWFDEATDSSGTNEGDPCEILLPPVGQWLETNIVVTLTNDLPNHVLGDFDENYLNLIVPQSATNSTYVDDSMVLVTNYIAIGTSGYYGAQITITNSGTHTVTSSQPVSVEAYGWGTWDAYGYFGGVVK